MLKNATGFGNSAGLRLQVLTELLAARVGWTFGS